MRIGFYAPCNEHNRHTGPLLGIAYIASYLQAELGIEDVFLEVDIHRAMERKPDVLAISSFSEKYNRVLHETTQLRHEHPDLPIVIGGPHISGMPHSLKPSLNVGVIGEGEKPMLGIVKALLEDGKLTPERLRLIQNLIFWNEKQELERTLFEDRIKDLDALPLPRREIMKAWWPSANQETVFDRGVYTSRGCSFRCHFCMYSERANLIRYVSIPKVMEDLETILSNYPEQKHIIFYDDLFVTKKSRLKELADAIRSEKIHQRVTFGCMAKTSFFDREFAQILRDMNMRVLSWGFESGSDPVLHYLKDRSSSVAKHQQAVDISNQYGMYSGGYFIIGSPMETVSDMAKTYWFIRNNIPRLPLIGIYPIIPLPGTSLWRETVQRGLLDENFENWQDLEFLQLEDSYLHLNEHYSKETLKTAYEKDFTPLMGWPNVIFPRLQERWQQTRHYLKLAADQIKPLLKPNSKILEISRGDRFLIYELELQHDAIECHWQDQEKFKSLDLTSFDTIIMTHTLEKIGFQSQLWQQLVALNKPIYLVVEQVGSLYYLLALLQNQFPGTIELADMYQVNYRFTLQSLQKALETQGFQLSHVDRFRYELDHRATELYQFLQPYLPLQSFRQEADVLAYGLYLPPLQPLLTDAPAMHQSTPTERVAPCALDSFTYIIFNKVAVKKSAHWGWVIWRRT